MELLVVVVKSDGGDATICGVYMHDECAGCGLGIDSYSVLQFKQIDRVNFCEKKCFEGCICFEV